MKQTFSKLWLALALMLTFGATASADDAVFNLTKETVTGGTLTLKVNGSEASTAAEGATVTVIAKPVSPLDKADITITSNMQWEAAHSRRLVPVDPSIVKSFKATPVAGKTYTYEFTMPANDVIVSALFSEMESLTQVPYIDAEGNEVTTPAGVKVYKLDGTEGELGVEGQTTWYVVQSALTYTEAIKLNGATNIIVTDGSKMSIGTAETPISNYCFTTTAAVDFSVFGQKGATGQFGFYNDRPQNNQLDDVVITSCDFVAHSPYGLYCNGNLTTWGANVTIHTDYDAIYANQSVAITQSDVKADGSHSGIASQNKDITITQSNVVAKGGYCGIEAGNGQLSITGGKVTANAPNGMAAINGYKGITIEDCVLTATSNTTSYGLCSIGGQGVSIDGGQVTIMGRTFGIYTPNREVSIGLKTVKDFVYVSSYYNSTVTLNQRTLAHDGLPTVLNPANSMLLESGTVSDLALVKDKTLRLGIQGSISFLEDEVYEYSGETITNTLHNNGDGKVTYSSSNESIATVDPVTGEVTIVGPGEAVITATVKDGLNYHYEPNTASFKLIAAPALSKVLLGYTAKDGVVYALYEDHATVVGVVESALPTWNETGKKITIVDKIAAKDGDVAVPVVAFASGWTDARTLQNGVTGSIDASQSGFQPGTPDANGQITWTNVSAGGTQTMTGYVTTAAKDIDAPIYMYIQAQKLTKITIPDVQDFKIKQFCLGQGCGIVKIPDYLFAPVDAIFTPEQDARRTEIEELLNGKGSKDNENETSDNFMGLKKLLETINATNTANAGSYAEWDAIYRQRQGYVEDAMQTGAYKAAQGKVEDAQKVKQAWENLQAVIVSVAQKWGLVSSTVKEALRLNSKEGLNETQGAIFDAVFEAMKKAKSVNGTGISTNGHGGYDIPYWETVANKIEEADAEIARLEAARDAIKYTPTGYVAEDTGLNTKTLAELQAAADAAKAERDKYAPVDTSALEERIGALEDELSDMEKEGYAFNPDGKNEVLEQVNIYNQLKKVQKYAFANCVNAKFKFANGDKVPASIVKGGFLTNAFLNTQFKNLDLSLTGKVDFNENGKIDEDEIFGNDNLDKTAFTGTPLERAILGTTNLDPIRVKDFMRAIKFDEVKDQYRFECIEDDLEDGKKDGFYTRTVNKTLKELVLPDATNLPEGVTSLYNRIPGLGGDDGTKGSFEDFVVLPAITIPAQVVEINKQAFMGCDALATITFAQENSQLYQILADAFNGTAAQDISLQKQTKLAIIKDRAFANMKNLETVNISYTQLTTLPSNVFYNSKKLYGVTFFDPAPTAPVTPEMTTHITCLPQGLFSTNAIKNLDLSKTHIIVLNDLFMAGPGDVKVQSVCNGVYKETVMNPLNKTLESIVLPENLQFINNFALACLQNANFKSVEIPSTVKFMGEGVFYNDANLETITMIDTQLTGFFARTFAQCAKLKDVYFVSVNGAKPYLFGQPTEENIMWNTYWKLDNTMPEIDGDLCIGSYVYPEIGNDIWEGQPGSVNQFIIDVFNNYVLPVTPADYDITDILTREQIAALKDHFGFDDNLFHSCGSALVNVYVTSSDFETLSALGNYTDGVGSYSKLIEYKKELTLAMEADLNGEHYYWGTFSSPYGAWFDSTQDVVIYSAYQMGNDIVLYPAKIKGPGKEGWYKVAAFDPDVDWYLPVADGLNWRQAKVIGNDAAAVCVIRSTTNKVTPKLYTDEVRKFQTTLDVENILTVARNDIQGSTNLNYYQLQANGTKLRFKHMNKEGDVLLKGSVVVKTEADQGYGVRDFYNVVVVEPDEATAVQGVKEYMNGIQSGAIYNLNGVRVDTPVKGKMYIQNGKKFVAK